MTNSLSAWRAEMHAQHVRNIGAIVPVSDNHAVSTNLLTKIDALIDAMTALHESNTALLAAMMESDASDGDAMVVASHPHGTMD